MITRYFNIKNFRNIGCNKNGTDVFVNYNYHLENESISYGDKLCSGTDLLIGGNNIGKSNVLDALRWFNDKDSYDVFYSKQKNYKSDFPRFDQKCKYFEVSCVVQDGRKNQDGYISGTLTHRQYRNMTKFENFVEFSDGFKFDLAQFNNTEKLLKDIYFDVKVLPAILPNNNSFCYNNSNCPYVCDSYSDELIDEICESYETYKTNQMVAQKTKEDFVNDLNKYSEIKRHNVGAYKDILDCLNPAIVYFNHELINELDFVYADGTSLAQYSLYNHYSLNVPYCLLRYLDYNPDEELLWSDKASDSELRDKESEINHKLHDFNEMFNHIFSVNGLNDHFEFTMYIEKGSFGIQLLKNGIDMQINEQSSAFIWLLKFYLSIVIYQGASPYSIVLIDEPFTNLSLGSIKEIKNVLKKLSETNKLTFIISTHSPSLVDADNLEEVRVLEPNNNDVKVIGFFNECEHDADKKYDLFKPIYSALSTDAKVLYNDTKNKIIFCEGISDYLFFTAYKEYFKKQAADYDLIFIPLNGVSPGQEYNILGKIGDIQTPSIFLVDNDDAGNEVRNMYNNRVETQKGPVPVLSLGDISPEFDAIESLFSDEDKKLFDINLNAEKDKRYWKKFIYASGIKKAILDGKGSKKTAENFEKVFKLLSSGELFVNTTFISKG